MGILQQRQAIQRRSIGLLLLFSTRGFPARTINEFKLRDRLPPSTHLVDNLYQSFVLIPHLPDVDDQIPSSHCLFGFAICAKLFFESRDAL